MDVEIWSDVTCPWSYIAKRRFEVALARFAHRGWVHVSWRSFELDPNAPCRYPGTFADLLVRAKGMTTAQSVAATDHLAALAAAEGLAFHFERMQPGNTLDAHRLLHLAAEKGRQGAVIEALFHAYFTDGMAIGDADTLLAITSTAGLEAHEVRATLAGNAYLAAVRADEQRAADLGITGTPCFVVGDTHRVSGAQPAAVFLTMLEQAWMAAG